MWWNQGKDGYNEAVKVVIAGFGGNRNLVGESKVFIKDEAKVASAVGGVK